jgi:transaldolase
VQLDWEDGMKFFVDTAEIKDIRELHELGLVDGVTTNPSLIAKAGRDFKETIREICSVVPGPVSAEVASVDYDNIMAEADVLAKLADNVVVKLPLTLAGLRACKHLTDRGIKTNVTLCFAPNQALLAAKAGATYISPFIGRLDDINLDGMELIEQIRTIYDNYNFETEILAASIRTPNHVTQAALAGADVATIPPAVIKKLADHPLTNSGLETFVKDWKSTGQSIL